MSHSSQQPPQPQTSPSTSDALQLSRRDLLFGSAVHLGGISLACLLNADGWAQDAPPSGNSKQLPHFKPRARQVIFLNMVGGASQLDMFEHKPLLRKFDGTPLPESLTQGERFAQVDPRSTVYSSPYEFQRSGQAGMWVSSLLPSFPDITDDICMIRSLRCKEINHPSAQLLLQTGFPRGGRPSIGAWLSYGLGTENANLPAYVVLRSGAVQFCGQECISNGFLSGRHHGLVLNSKGEPVYYLNNPPGMTRKVRGLTIDAISRINQNRHALVNDPEIQTRISQYELAFQMQTAVPELTDFSGEKAATFKMYGIQDARTPFARNCLMARRLIERGVRFVQLDHGDWDLHNSLETHLPRLCRETERACVALVKDLKQRGLLDSTLVIWGTEFGRTPMRQEPFDRTQIRQDTIGRGHHKTFTIWMAGGGLKAGFLYGETDEFGYAPISNSMEIHDLQATILHLLGIDHTKFTFQLRGRSYRLTDIGGTVHSELFA